MKAPCPLKHQPTNQPAMNTYAKNVISRLAIVHRALTPRERRAIRDRIGNTMEKSLCTQVSMGHLTGRTSIRVSEYEQTKDMKNSRTPKVVYDLLLRYLDLDLGVDIRGSLTRLADLEREQKRQVALLSALAHDIETDTNRTVTSISRHLNDIIERYK